MGSGVYCEFCEREFKKGEEIVQFANMEFHEDCLQRYVTKESHYTTA